MIFVDPRDGSDTLVAPLRRAGLEIDDKAQLPGGDLYWVGRGEKHAPLNIGVEYKKVSDLVTSIRDERLTGVQLPAMKGIEQPTDKPFYDVAYLLIEGERLYNKDGIMLRRVGPRHTKPLEGHMNIAELFKRLNVLHLCGGLNWVWLDNQRECVQWIAATYHTWTDVALDEHKSHLGYYQAPALSRESKRRTFLRGLPGVGPAIAAAAERKFGTPRRAISARWQEWSTLETRDNHGKTKKFGDSAARKLDAFLDATDAGAGR